MSLIPENNDELRRSTLLVPTVDRDNMISVYISDTNQEMIKGFETTERSRNKSSTVKTIILDSD